MPGKGSSPPLWRKGVGRAFLACFAILAFQAVEPVVDALEDIGATNPHPLQGNVSDDFLSAPQQTAAQWSRASAATSSEPRQGRQGRDGSTEDMNAGSSQLQPVDGEYEKTSTEDVDVVCFSRDLSGILDQTTGEFIDQGRTAEEVLLEMKAKSLEPGRAEALDAFASMIEGGKIDSSLIAPLFPISAVVFLVVAVLIFLLLLFCVGPMICCRCCRCCCCCVRRRAHAKGCRVPCYLILGSALGLFAVVVAIAAYRVDRKALDEATAVVCAGGRSVDAVLYGTRTSQESEVQGEVVGFEGMKNLLGRARKLADAADGNNPNNMVHEVKEEILELVNIDHEKDRFKNAKADTTDNIAEVKRVTGAADHLNVFVEKHESTLLAALKTIETELGNIDLTTAINDALKDVDLPLADLSAFDDAEQLIDMLTDTAESVGRVSVSAKGIVDMLDFALLCVSAVSGALVVMAVVTLICQLFVPNKCARRILGFWAILMTIFSVVVCITVVVVSLIHKAALPACDYAAVRFTDLNSEHPFAKMYGEDSAIFQALSTCLSEKGSGDLLQEDDGTNRIDPILEKLEESKKEICAKIPKPPTVNFKNLDTFGDNARLQGWAVVLRDRSSFSTFKKVQDSGIQEPDSRVQVDDITGTIYGLQTVRSLVHPWKVVISDSSSPGELIVTSQAPSEEVLNKWFDECSANVGRNTIDCEKVREAVRLLKKKIALMIAPAACYGSSSGTPATVCTVPELMGGVGESPVPQNALDRSVTDVIGVVNELKAKVEGSSDAACNVAEKKIDYINDEVLNLKNGSNCKFARDRFIRLTSHLCYGAIDGLGTGSFLYFILAIAMFFFSLLLLILIIKDRDNDRYREPEYTAAAGGAAEPVQGAPEAVVPPPQEVQGPESSKAIVAPEGDGYAPEGKMPQAEAQAGSVDCRASHSEGANEVVAHNGIGPRMASIP